MYVFELYFFITVSLKNGKININSMGVIIKKRQFECFLCSKRNKKCIENRIF